MESAIKSEKGSFWRGEIALFEKFDGSVLAFCRTRGLSSFRFRYWAKKLGRANTGRDLVAPAFIAVEVAELKSARSALPDPRWLAEFIVHLSGAVR